MHYGYIQKAVFQGWSRDRLEGQIESDLFHRQGKAITNFKQNLPEVLENQAQNLLKNPYNLDFLCLTDEAYEREIENKLVLHIEKFLLELGEGVRHEVVHKSCFHYGKVGNHPCHWMNLGV